MADDHGIVASRIELAAGGICYGNIVEGRAGFEGKLRNDGDGLLGYEGGEWVFWLFFYACCERDVRLPALGDVLLSIVVLKHTVLHLRSNLYEMGKYC
jgi:hypothetical protein